MKRLRLRLTTIGAIVGGALAFLWSDLLNELLYVALGAAIGWVVTYGLVLLTGLFLDEVEAAGEAEHLADERTRSELYEEAQRLDVDGRSDMNKDELAAAVARERS